MLCSLFEKKEGKSVYGMAMYFDHLLVFVGAMSRCRCYSAKEAKMWAIPIAIKKTKHFEILNTHVFSNAMDVIKVIKGAQDWAIKKGTNVQSYIYPILDPIKSRIQNLALDYGSNSD